jgi:hypothetical protein
VRRGRGGGLAGRCTADTRILQERYSTHILQGGGAASAVAQCPVARCSTHTLQEPGGDGKEGEHSPAGARGWGRTRLGSYHRSRRRQQAAPVHISRVYYLIRALRFFCFFFLRKNPSHAAIAVGMAPAPHWQAGRCPLRPAPPVPPTRPRPPACRHTPALWSLLQAARRPLRFVFACSRIPRPHSVVVPRSSSVRTENQNQEPRVPCPVRATQLAARCASNAPPSPVPPMH